LWALASSSSPLEHGNTQGYRISENVTHLVSVKISLLKFYCSNWN